MIIKNAEFITSVADADKVMQNEIPEIAVAGKSNVGKSSFINFLTGYGKLAKTSKEPGRTRLINYFGCNNREFILVDLPGYGFAKVSDAEKLKWGSLIEGYFQNSPTLKNVLLLVDIRREPSEDDIMMVNYLYHYAIPFTIVATKADKVPKSTLQNHKKRVSTAYKVGVDNVIVTSSLKKLGKEEMLSRLWEILSPYIAEKLEG